MLPNRRVRYGTKVVKRDTEALLGWPNHPGLDGPFAETPEPPFADVRHGCQMAIARCVWPFGLLDYGSATLRCKI